MICRKKSARRAERLAERADDEIDIGLDPVGLGGAPAMITEDAQ